MIIICYYNYYDPLAGEQTGLLEAKLYIKTGGERLLRRNSH